jgi:hypothetical protein
VAEREPPLQQTTALHVTLRQAVRPVIVAHGILSRQEVAAYALAEEAKALCDLTEELLRKLGRVDLLTAGSSVAQSDVAQGDMADRLVDAYAQAGMSWAKVLGSVTNLAARLADEHDCGTASLLAQVVAEAGETAVAKRIKQFIDEAKEAAAREQLANIRVHSLVSAVQIREAITRLGEIPEPSEREQAIRTRRGSLVTSVKTIAHQSESLIAQQLADDLFNRIQTLQVYPHYENNNFYPQFKFSEGSLFSEILTILICAASRPQMVRALDG